MGGGQTADGEDDDDDDDDDAGGVVLRGIAGISLNELRRSRGRKGKG